jgi:phosphatidylinositol glycan class U
MDGAKVNPGRTAGLYVGAAVLRLALFTLFPGLPDLLTGRVEISTPVTSFKRRAFLPCPNPQPSPFAQANS